MRKEYDRPRTMPSVSRAAKPNHWNEVIGLCLIVLGVAYFMALVSYTPRDVPTWVWFSTASPPNNPAQNFVGPVGAVIAGFSYLSIGAAGYLLAALAMGYGGFKVLTGSKIGNRLPWVIAVIVSGACLAQLQPWFLKTWGQDFNIDGPGGTVGYQLGAAVLRKLLGGPGSLTVIGGFYVISLILATGVRPIHVLMASVTALKRWISNSIAAAEKRKLERASEAERKAVELKRLAKEQRLVEKTLRKKGISPDSIPAAGPSGSEPEAFRPPPKVTDTSLPLPVASKPKPKAEKKEQSLLQNNAAAFENYELPEMDLLDQLDFAGRTGANHDELLAIQATLIETLAHFGIQASPGDITKGPTITRYEVYPAQGVRVDRISSLEADIQRATRAERINILAPIPGKDTVGIEIANSKKVKVILREILESEDWANTKAKIPIALGKDVYGKTIIADLAAMPHCLVAGTTGSGKSVCINAVIASILYRFTPDELRFIMIDPKVVEMQIYNTLPHLVVPVVTDPKKVLLALRWVINEMENRYQMFAKVGVRNIATFNVRPLPKTQKELDAAKGAGAAKPAGSAAATDLFLSDDATDNSSAEEEAAPRPPVRNIRDTDLIIPDRLPYIIVIVDELADLMQTAPADVESAIARITQKARAAGIHMIVATQTPRADVITGVIKANVPSRIAFQVASGLDSRIILDEKGAERLLGQGDMLYLPPSSSRLVRSQGVLVTDEEIRRLVDFVSRQAPPSFDVNVQESIDSGSDPTEEVSEEDEELVQKCLEIIRQEKKASTSLLQRRLRLGYTRAARIVDILEDRGILGPGEGAKPREILVDLDALV